MGRLNFEQQEICDNFRGFVNNFSSALKEKNFVCTDFSELENYTLLQNQALYVFDLQVQSVPFQRNIKSLLGYSKEEFNYDLITRFYHPDDFQHHLMILKHFNQFFQKYNPDPFSLVFSASFRIRRKDNSYIKVIRHSTNFRNDENVNPVCSLSILSDVTELKKDNIVTFSINGEGKEVEEAKQFFVDFYQNEFFSKREKQLLVQLSMGKNSRDISLELGISKHTVDTHRRKMLQKSGCKNTIELINFCNQRGII